MVDWLLGKLSIDQPDMTKLLAAGTPHTGTCRRAAAADHTVAGSARGQFWHWEGA